MSPLPAAPALPSCGNSDSGKAKIPSPHPRNTRSAAGVGKGKERRKWLRVSILCPHPQNPSPSSSGSRPGRGGKGGTPRAVPGVSAPQFPARLPRPVPHGCVLTPGSPLNGRKEILILGKGRTRPLPPAVLGRGPGPASAPGRPGWKTGLGSVLVGSHGNGDRMGGPLWDPQTRSICRRGSGGSRSRSKQRSPGNGGSQLRAGAGAGADPSPGAGVGWG